MILHSWNVTPSQARAIQVQLKDAVILEDQLGPVQRVAGIDVGFEAGNNITRAAVVVLAFPGLDLLEQTVARRPTAFPYLPGLLSFREVPAVLDALRQLRLTPDLLLCDGQGIAHPRRLGIASHLGVLTGLPTIGVAKSRLCGTHGAVSEDKGAWTPLIDKNEVIGAVLRSRRGVKPLYISPGHKITLPTALNHVMRCVTRYRLPETTRLAHRLASG